MRSLAFAIVLTAAGVSRAENWSQFRGPGGGGVSSETNLPLKWSKTEGVRWKAPLPARGVSSPVVHNGKVFVTCSSGTRDDRLHTVAFDAATGTQLWHRQLVATGNTACHPTSCMAAPTPAADDAGVYCLFATGDLAAYDPAGNLLWYRSLVGDYPTITNQVGMASSPVVRKGKLFVPMDNSGESFLAALDAGTGKNVWKVERKRETNWVTPLLRETGGTAEVIFPRAGELVAYNADTGEKIWSHGSGAAGGDIPSPSIGNGVIFLPNRGLVALQPAEGKAKELWKSPKMQTGMSSPVAYDGFVYGATSGVVVAADAKTGVVAWQERYKGRSTASPVAGDGKVYVTNETGGTTVMKAGPTAEILGTNDLDEETLGTPAVSGGALFIRTKTMLYCVGK